MSHWGIPGPGGSMGKCAVCGEDFCKEVFMDFVGLDFNVETFTVGFVKETLHAHAPKCVDAVKAAFTSDDPATVRDRLPEGPLRKCLADAIESVRP